MNESPDDEIHRVGSGRVLSTRVSVSVELGASSSWYVGVFTKLEALRTPSLWDFSRGSSFWHDSSLTPFLALSSYLENGSKAENSKLLIMAWSFW